MKLEEMINKVHNADCLEFMKQIPDKSIDLVLTDPPYGIDYQYDKYIDSEENLMKIITNILPELLRVGKRVAIFSGVNNIHKYPKSDWIMSWTWNTTGSFGKLGFNQWQPILFYGNDIKGFGSINGEIKSDRLDFSGMGSTNFSKNEHPCPKPNKVMERLVKRFSQENDIILDPFLGSGTTAVAAKMLKRNFIGIELSEKYCDIAQQRLDDLDRQPNLL